MTFLIDAQLPPALASWLIQQGHTAQHVDDLGLRLGEGSGAALALPLLSAAAAVLSGMATFEAAGVTDAGA